MSDITVDTDGDIDISTGSFVLNTGIESVRQHLYIRLRTFLGEWFLDENVGVPYLQQILGVKNPDPVLLNSIFRREILKCTGVVGINSIQFQFDSSTRELVLTASIQTLDGAIDFSQALGA